MNTCILSLDGFRTGPITLHLALFSGLCTRASCFVLPIWYHGWRKFKWIEWKCRLFFSNHFLASLRLLQAILSLCRWKTYGNLLCIALQYTTFCAERFAEFGYCWFSGLTWIEEPRKNQWEIQEEPRKNQWEIQEVQLLYQLYQISVSSWLSEAAKFALFSGRQKSNHSVFYISRKRVLHPESLILSSW